MRRHKRTAAWTNQRTNIKLASILCDCDSMDVEKNKKSQLTTFHTRVRLNFSVWMCACVLWEWWCSCVWKPDMKRYLSSVNPAIRITVHDEITPTCRSITNSSTLYSTLFPVDLKRKMTLYFFIYRTYFICIWVPISILTLEASKNRFRTMILSRLRTHFSWKITKELRNIEESR